MFGILASGQRIDADIMQEVLLQLRPTENRVSQCLSSFMRVCIVVVQNLCNSSVEFKQDVLKQSAESIVNAMAVHTAGT